MELLNNRQLASRIGRSERFVVAMKRAGFRPSHGRYTTAQAALDWLKANPDFTSTKWMRKRSKHQTFPSLSDGGKFCGQS